MSESRKANGWSGSGVWLIHAPALAEYRAGLDRMALTRDDLARSESSASTPRLLSVLPGGVGVLSIGGMIRRYATPVNALMAEAFGGTTCDWIGEALDAALASDKVKCLLLNVDSPGGEANGIAELAGRIEAATRQKPMASYVGGFGTSAAYWLAAAAGKITAAPTAFMGSIGTVRMVEDDTEGQAKAGVKTHVFVSTQSPRKWPDPKTPIGAAQYQEYVDAQSDVFLADVARLRRTTPLRVMEDFGQGDMMIASEALKVGMIDAVGTLESAVTGLRGRAPVARIGAGGKVLAVGAMKPFTARFAGRK